MPHWTRLCLSSLSCWLTLPTLFGFYILLLSSCLSSLGSFLTWIKFSFLFLFLCLVCLFWSRSPLMCIFCYGYIPIYVFLTLFDPYSAPSFKKLLSSLSDSADVFHIYHPHSIFFSFFSYISYHPVSKSQRQYNNKIISSIISLKIAWEYSFSILLFLSDELQWMH